MIQKARALQERHPFWGRFLIGTATALVLAPAGYLIIISGVFLVKGIFPFDFEIMFLFWGGFEFVLLFSILAGRVRLAVSNPDQYGGWLFRPAIRRPFLGSFVVLAVTYSLILTMVSVSYGWLVPGREIYWPGIVLFDGICVVLAFIFAWAIRKGDPV